MNLFQGLGVYEHKVITVYSNAISVILEIWDFDDFISHMYCLLWDFDVFISHMYCLLSKFKTITLTMIKMKREKNHGCAYKNLFNRT